MNSEPHIIERDDDLPILIDVRGPIGGETVIFCHGYKGYKDWGCWNLMADYLADNSICVVKFNFSKNGGTMADPIDFPSLENFGNNNYSQEVKDLGNVIDAVEQAFQFTKLTIVGHSRGGGIVNLVAAKDSRVNRVITIAGVSEFSSRFPKDQYLALWKEKGVFHVKNARTEQEMPHFYQFFEDFEKNREKLNVSRAASEIEIPYLIIHGSEDEAVSVNEAFNLNKWCKSSVLKIIDGAGHTFGSKQPWDSNEMPQHLHDACELMIDFIVES